MRCRASARAGALGLLFRPLRLRVPPQSLLLLLLLSAVLQKCQITSGTEVRWINPERGPIKGGTGVLVKGLDFKHAGLGDLDCKFHRITVPAQVVSATLIKCSSPEIYTPAQVEVTVIERATGRQLPGQELLYDYYNCDARECHIGDFVPTNAPLSGEEDESAGDVATVANPSPVQAKAPADNDASTSEERTPPSTAARSEEGWGPADVVEEGREAEDMAASVEFRSAANSVKQPPQIAQGPSAAPAPALENVHQHQRALTAEERILQERRRRKQERAAAEEERRRQEEEAEAAERARILAEQELEEGEDDGINVVGVAILACVGLYSLRLIRAALWGPSKARASSAVVLPEVSAVERCRSLNLKHIDPSGNWETLVRTDSVNTTCSSPALERANSTRPNERGVRKKANLRMGGADEHEDEKASLGHLRWLMGADGQALQKLQALLSGLKANPLDSDELLLKLQAFDAQRLLHSPAVCTQALVDAGISQGEATAVATALYTPGSPMTPLSRPGSPFQASSGLAAKSAFSAPPEHSSRRTLSSGHLVLDRSLSSTSSPVRASSPIRLHGAGGSGPPTLASLGESRQASLGPKPRSATETMLRYTPGSPMAPAAAPSSPMRAFERRHSMNATSPNQAPSPSRLQSTSVTSLAPSARPSLPPPRVNLPRPDMAPRNQQQQLNPQAMMEAPTAPGLLQTTRIPPSQPAGSLALKLPESPKQSSDTPAEDLQQPGTPPESPTKAVPLSPGSPSPRGNADDGDWASPRGDGDGKAEAKPKDGPSFGMMPVFTAMRPPEKVNSSRHPLFNNDLFGPADSNAGSVTGTPSTPALKPSVLAQSASPISPFQLQEQKSSS